MTLANIDTNTKYGPFLIGRIQDGASKDRLKDKVWTILERKIPRWHCSVREKKTAWLPRQKKVGQHNLRL